MDFTFDNMLQNFRNFVNIKDDTLDISKYNFIEPVGVAILKALKLDNPSLKIITNPVNPSSSYIDTMLNFDYSPQKTYYPVKNIKTGDISEYIEDISDFLMKNFAYMDRESFKDLKDYVSYMISEILNNALVHSLSPLGAVIAGFFIKAQAL